MDIDTIENDRLVLLVDEVLLTFDKVQASPIEMIATCTFLINRIKEVHGIEVKNMTFCEIDGDVH